MALIELNLEKPALKRVEASEETVADEQSVEFESGTESTGVETMETTSAEMMETTGDDTESQSTEDKQSSGGRVRRYGRRLALLGGTAAGVAAARKLRQRRKGSEQQELEEDWQTAE